MSLPNTVVILDDSVERLESMQDCLTEYSQWSIRCFDNAPDLISWLSTHLEECCLISLDHDLGSDRSIQGEWINPGTGRDVVNFLASQFPHCPTIIHSSNSQEVIGMEMTLGGSYWTFERVFPHRDLDWIQTDWVSTVKLFLEPLDHQSLRPENLPESDANWQDIFRFALSFNPYLQGESWGSCFAAGKKNKQIFLREKILPSTINELRMCLWFERSYWRGRLSEPDDQTMVYLQAILEKIRLLINSEQQFIEFSKPRSLHPRIIEQIKGVIYGQAVADALGLGTEGFTSDEVQTYYPNGFNSISEIVRDKHRSAWVSGDWTDDTDMMLCILDSLLKLQRVDLLDIACEFYQWASEGHPGIGFSTHQVLFSKYVANREFFQENFEENYYLAAQQYWEDSGRKMAPNGGVMRTSILGIWEYPWRDRVKSNAAKVCQITHYDPRCVGSSVAVSLAISELLKGELELEDIITGIQTEVAEYHPELLDYFQRANQPDFAQLKLGEPQAMGYTLKTMSAGFWALKYATSYQDGILKIVQAGGDADTNAAVAGALLGAKFGVQSIPQCWLNELAYKQQLETRIEQLLYLVNEQINS